MYVRHGCVDVREVSVRVCVWERDVVEWVSY